MSTARFFHRVQTIALIGTTALAACGQQPAPEEEGGDPGALVSPGSVSAAVVNHFFPRNIWYNFDEPCPFPAGNGSPNGRVVYSVRPHPDRSSDALLSFGLLFRDDCGVAGSAAHPGDAEHFSMTLARDAVCSTGWRALNLKTVAHGGTLPHEIAEVALDTCDPVNQEIFVSRGKHALYLSMEQAGMRVPAEVVGRGWRSGYILYDVGTRAAPTLYNNLGLLGFPGESVWTDADNRFCGGSDRCGTCPGLNCTGTGSVPGGALESTDRARISSGGHRRLLQVRNDAAYNIRYRTNVNGTIGGWNTLTGLGGFTASIHVSTLDSVDVDLDSYNGSSWSPLCRRSVITSQPHSYMQVRARGTLVSGRGCDWNFPEPLGGWDLAAACTRQQGSGATPVLLVSPYSHAAALRWACRRNGVDYGIDGHRLCREQYAVSNAQANYKDEDNAYSWYCHR